MSLPTPSTPLDQRDPKSAHGPSLAADLDAISDLKRVGVGNPDLGFGGCP
jgi:hypothetical protein